MPLDTYASLREAIVRWAMRAGDSEFEAQVPDFIALNEARLNRQLRVRDMEAVATLTPDASGEAALPADFIEVREAIIDDPTPRLLRAAPPSLAGQPYGINPSAATHYAISGNALTLLPAGETPVRLRYYARIPALSDAAPTNWLLQRYPDAYLYGALIEAAKYMMDDAALARAVAFYDRAVADIVSEDDRAKFARAAVRWRGPTP